MNAKVEVSTLALDVGSFPIMLHSYPGHGKTHMIGTLAAAGKRVVLMDIGGGPNTIARSLKPEHRQNVKVISGVVGLQSFRVGYKKAEAFMKAGGDFFALDCCTQLQKHIAREARAELSNEGDSSEMIVSKGLSIPLNDAIKQRMEDICNAVLALPGGKVFTFWTKEDGDGKRIPNTRGDVWEYYAGNCELILFLEAKNAARKQKDFGEEETDDDLAVTYSCYTRQVGNFEARDRLNLFPAKIKPDFAEVLSRLEALE